MEVDVSDSLVQWEKCLRVRVRIDVTKKMVRGKKITIEEGESRYTSNMKDCLTSTTDVVY